MSTFYVTFGQQYCREPHPTLPTAHPDGWVTVVAADELAARRLAVEWLGTAWSSIYDEEPDRALFRLGELHRIEAGEAS
jgi:hypothetical protein